MIGLLAMMAAAPLVVRVDGPPCRIELNGAAVKADELTRAVGSSKRHRSAVIRYNPAVPYRCIGEVIYNLQRAKARITFDPPLPH